MSDPARLEAIESKIAHLEHALSELSDVLYRQQKEIQLVQVRSHELKSQLDALLAPPDAGAAAQEKPPHF